MPAQPRIRRWVVLGGWLTPVLLMATALATAAAGTVTWVMVGGVSAASLVVGRACPERFYAPGVSALLLAVLWFALAALWRGWEAAAYMVEQQPLFFLSGVMGLLGGYLASKAR